MRLLPHTYQEIYRPENHEILTCETCGCILYAAETGCSAGITRRIVVRTGRKSFGSCCIVIRA